MSQFLTVKEAAKLTGKSPSSIRRVIYPIIHDDAHADRSHIAPSVEEAQALRLKGENFAWRISEELLQRAVPATPPSEKTSASSVAKDGHAELLVMLREELQIKNQQITQQTEMLSKQMELISGLSERLREGNILIGSLQQRLALTEGSPRAKSDDDKMPTSKAGGGESSSKAKNVSTAKLAKKKRGAFHWLFG